MLHLFSKWKQKMIADFGSLKFVPDKRTLITSCYHIFISLLQIFKRVYLQIFLRHICSSCLTMTIAEYIVAYDIFNIYFRRIHLKYMPNDIDRYTVLCQFPWEKLIALFLGRGSLFAGNILLHLTIYHHSCAGHTH